MTFSSDPRDPPLETRPRDTGMWAAGAIAVLLVAGLVVFAATRPTHEAATIPATTTGSGAPAQR